MQKQSPAAVFRKSRALALALFLTAACSTAELTAEKASFAILHLSDTHVCQLAGAHPQLAQKRQRYDKSFESLRRALKVLPKRVGADAVVITGDMVDSWEIESPQGNLLTNQVERFASAASPVRVPLWLTLGNHDIRTHAVSQRIESRKGNPSTLQPHAEAARSAWVRGMQCFRDGAYYYRDIRVGETPWRLYFLNDGYYLEDDPLGNLWDLAQLYWLENELDKSPERKAILFFHIPLPVDDTNGDGIHFKKPPEGWPFPDSHQKGILKILNEHPSVVAAFVGHNHDNIVEDIPLPAGHKVTQVETGAFALDTDNWRVIKIGERGVSISKPGSTELEKVVELLDRGVAP